MASTKDNLQKLAVLQSRLERGNKKVLKKIATMKSHIEEAYQHLNETDKLITNIKKVRASLRDA